MTPSDLRKQLRQIRQTLDSQTQQQNASLAFEAFKSYTDNRFPEPSKIALFLSQDGELDTRKCIEFLWQQTQHQVYLPVLETRDGLHMAFVEYRPDSIMKNNQFGISEPDVPFSEHLTGRELDMVLMPLVGFDEQGNRLGMGGGYYDRTFEFKLKTPNQHPKLIGWAHSCQKVEQLPCEPWDVPINGIITEEGLIEWPR